MKNIQKIISIIFLAAFVIALMQCSKDTTNDNPLLNISDKSQKDNGIENRSVLTECFTPPCQNYTSLEITDTIVVPGYCGTSIVRFTVGWCPGTSILYFTEFRADILVWCDSLRNSWYYLSDDQLDLAYDRYQYRASLVAEKEYMESILSPQNNTCPNYATEAHFYTNLCYKWCKTVYGRPGEDAYITMGQVPCGTKCCIRNRSYCYQNGVLTISNPTFIGVGTGQCGTTPIGDCQGGTLIGSCERTCGAP